MIAPRFASGQARVGFGHGLPYEIKEGIRKIAWRHNKSMSWVMEEMIIKYFHLHRPEYLKPKAKLEAPKSKPATQDILKVRDRLTIQ